MHKTYNNAENNFLNTDFGTLNLRGEAAILAQWIVIGVTVYRCIQWVAKEFRKN